jgi:glycosyltransferase involved in cell wall biosynthesis
MKKLAFMCCSGGWGGLEILNLQYLLWLNGHFELTFIGSKDTKIMSEVEKTSIPFIYFEPKRKHFDFKNIFTLSKILNENKIDFLLIGHYQQQYTAVLAKLFTANTKIIFLQHMQILLNKRDLYHSFFFKKIDYWLCPMDYLKTELLQNTTLKNSQIIVLNHSLETEKFIENKITKSEAREILNLPLNKLIIGNIGRLETMKAQDCIIKAAVNIPECHVMLVGDETAGGTGYKHYLIDLCRKLQIIDRVHFIPFTKNTEIAFRAMDIFIMPSLKESIGMVTIEAMLSKTPILGSNSGGTRELLENETLGFTFNPGDEFDLQKKLNYMLVNPNQVLEKTNHAFMSSQRKYSKNAWIENFINILNS